MQKARCLAARAGSWTSGQLPGIVLPQLPFNSTMLPSAGVAGQQRGIVHLLLPKLLPMARPLPAPWPPLAWWPDRHPLAFHCQGVSLASSPDDLPYTYFKSIWETVFWMNVSKIQRNWFKVVIMSCSKYDLSLFSLKHVKCVFLQQGSMHIYISKQAWLLARWAKKAAPSSKRDTKKIKIPDLHHQLWFIIVVMIILHHDLRP